MRLRSPVPSRSFGTRPVGHRAGGQREAAAASGECFHAGLSHSEAKVAVPASGVRGALPLGTCSPSPPPQLAPCVLSWGRLSRPSAALGSQDEGFSPRKRTEEPGVCAQGPRPAEEGPAEEMGVGTTGRGQGAGQVKPQGSAPQDARRSEASWFGPVFSGGKGGGQGAVCG